MKKSYILLLGLIIISLNSNAQWQSQLVNISEDGKIVYNKDADGFVIPDFSNAGYKNGLPIPEVDLPERTVTISPLADEDNTAHIQAAIDQVGQFELDENGFRGIVLLNPGTYLVNGTIYVKYDGVIFRGSGRESDPLTSTILYCENAVEQARNIVHLGSLSNHRWGNRSGQNATNITTSKVMPGDYSFDVADASAYSVGDLICIKYPTTQAWINAVKNGGNTGNFTGYWSADNIDMSYHRYIRAISGNTITTDAPIFYCLNQQYATPYIYQIEEEETDRKILHNIGIENMRIEFKRTSASSSSTADQNCILMCSMENSWAKGLYLTGFIHSGIKTYSVTRSTIEDCHSMNPSGLRTGANHYNFESYHRSQLILYKDCKVRKGRHHYISNGGATVSGIVVLNMASTDDGQDGISEGHRLWSQGILFDNWIERTETGLTIWNRYKLGMYLRQNMGSGHGWGGTNSVFWNCDIQQGGMYLDKVPTGQNYAIGCVAKDIKKYVNSSSYTTGYIEGQNVADLYPKSLYKAQLEYRLQGSVSSSLNDIEQDDYGIRIANYNKQLEFNSPYAGKLTLYSLKGQKLRSINVDANSDIIINLDNHQAYVIVFDNKEIKYRKVIISQ